jgi:hypothetical protein
MPRIAFIDQSFEYTQSTFGPWLINSPSWKLLFGESPFRYIINTTISSQISVISTYHSLEKQTLYPFRPNSESRPLPSFRSFTLFFNFGQSSTSTGCRSFCKHNLSTAGSDSVIPLYTTLWKSLQAAQVPLRPQDSIRILCGIFLKCLV